MKNVRKISHRFPWGISDEFYLRFKVVKNDKYSK